MMPMSHRKHLRAVALFSALACLQGCYYVQAARGQLDVMQKREPIDEVIGSDNTSAELAERLKLVQDARQFSIEELRLPDNDSYRSYADLERDYVVWNVVAAPEFSLQPKTWCFPVAGCVNYRGYFDEAAARRKAEKLEGKGYDVTVGGVAAYSTLGKFSDPVLNTMMRWEDVDLAAVLFHELAHQELYIKGDSEFNESFASAVEEFGVRRWLASRGSDGELDAYWQRRDLRERLVNLVEEARAELEVIYAADTSTDTMRTKKQERLDQLTTAINAELEQSGREAPEWLRDGLNNARLASMALYHGRLPEFRALLSDCNDDIECFYAAAATLAESDRGVAQRK